MTVSQYTPIDCDQHDYLEIACMKGYTVRITISTGGYLTGVAETTVTQPDKSEWLAIRTQTGSQNVRLDQINSMTVLTHPALFSEVDLTIKHENGSKS